MEFIRNMKKKRERKKHGEATDAKEIVSPVQYLIKIDCSRRSEENE